MHLKNATRSLKCAFARKLFLNADSVMLTWECFWNSFVVVQWTVQSLFETLFSIFSRRYCICCDAWYPVMHKTFFVASPTPSHSIIPNNLRSNRPTMSLLNAALFYATHIEGGFVKDNSFLVEEMVRTITFISSIHIIDPESNPE